MTTARLQAVAAVEAEDATTLCLAMEESLMEVESGLRVLLMALNPESSHDRTRRDDAAISEVADRTLSTFMDLDKQWEGLCDRLARHRSTSP